MPVVAATALSRASATGLALLLTMSLAACGSSSKGSPSDQGIAKPASPAKAVLSPEALVKGIALVDGDFTDGSTVRLFIAGDEVTGQITLDNCGSLFTTEQHRVARHQTAIVPPKGRSIMMSNEVVAYDSAANAAKALTELRASITHCPNDVFVPSAVRDTPDMRFDVSKLSTLPDAPVKDTVVETVQYSVRGYRKPAYGMLIFQRQGTVLDALYLQSRKKPTAANLAAARALAQITGKRLAAT
jgi:hypothetical protein